MARLLMGVIFFIGIAFVTKKCRIVFKGIANVKVPAGKFKECLKFLVKVEGIDVEEGSYYFAERVYFAEGVGMIKDVRVKESGDTGCVLGTESLADFNGIRKLKEYFLAD